VKLSKVASFINFITSVAQRPFARCVNACGNLSGGASNSAPRSELNARNCTRRQTTTRKLVNFPPYVSPCISITSRIQLLSRRFSSPEGSKRSRTNWNHSASPPGQVASKFQKIPPRAFTVGTRNSGWRASHRINQSIPCGGV
jgi:hypothetical protein